MQQSRSAASADTCLAVTAGTQRLGVHQVEALAGTYTLTVVEVTGYLRDSVVRANGRNEDVVRRGTLELWEPDSAHRYIGPYEFPLNGATDIDLSHIATMEFTNPPLTSRDPDKPGVQVANGAP